MRFWTYIILWARDPDGWFAFDQTKPALMNASETASAVWRMRSTWDDYKNPIGVYRYDGASWRMAAMQRDPMKNVALR